MSDSEWRPIASAPRDGTEILLWVPLKRSSGGCRVVGKWATDFEGELCGRPYWEGWQDPMAADKICDETEASHWLPLPAPPTPAAASGTPTGDPA